MRDQFGFHVLGQRAIFRDNILGLREDELKDPEGRTFRRKVIEYKNASAMVPLTTEGNVLLIRQYRHPVGKIVWDLPGGMVESGEDPRLTAIRELAEETGHVAAEVSFLYRYNPEPALSDQEIFLFRGEGVVPTAESRIVAESEISQIRSFTPAEVIEKLHSGDIASSWSIIGLLLVCAGGRSR